MFCTYLTIYKGNLLPPFYIGHTTVSKINNGYRGSVSSKRYKKLWIDELQSNPTLFTTKILAIYNTREDALNAEAKLQRMLKCKDNPLYINMASADRKFSVEKAGKNNPMYGSKRTGQQNPMYGRKHSDETRRKMRESGGRTAGIPKSAEHRRKIADANRGRKLSPESRKLVSENMPRFTCEFCGIRAIAVNYKRWHGPNCKHSTIKKF